MCETNPTLPARILRLFPDLVPSGGWSLETLGEARYAFILTVDRAFLREGYRAWYTRKRGYRLARWVCLLGGLSCAAAAILDPARDVGNDMLAGFMSFLALAGWTGPYWRSRLDSWRMPKGAKSACRVDLHERGIRVRTASQDGAFAWAALGTVSIGETGILFRPALGPFHWWPRRLLEGFFPYHAFTGFVRARMERPGLRGAG